MDGPGVQRTAGIGKDRRELETEIRRCMPSGALSWVRSHPTMTRTHDGLECPAGQIKTAQEIRLACGVPATKAGPCGQKSACGMTILVFGSSEKIVAERESG